MKIAYKGGHFQPSNERHKKAATVDFCRHPEHLQEIPTADFALATILKLLGIKGRYPEALEIARLNLLLRGMDFHLGYFHPEARN